MFIRIVLAHRLRVCKDGLGCDLWGCVETFERWIEKSKCVYIELDKQIIYRKKGKLNTSPPAI